MMKFLKFAGLVALFVAFESVFIVSETEQVLIERFGSIKHVYNTAGLKMKLPFIDKVIVRENRVLNLESEEIQAILSDKKQLVVDAFARYRIANTSKFYQAVRDEMTANSKLATILDSATRSVLGKQNLQDVLSGERVDLMGEIRALADKQTRDLGVEIIDVRIRRADLPKENSESVFNRMKAERQQQAAQFRAEGNERATEIRAKAESQSLVIVANAKKDADILRGEGDGLRNRIFAESYQQDAGFFEFYRSLKAYEKVMADAADTTVILSSDTEFMKYIGKK